MVKIKCKKCGYEWEYIGRGEMDRFYITCANCHRSIKKLEVIEEIKL